MNNKKEFREKTYTNNKKSDRNPIRREEKRRARANSNFEKRQHLLEERKNKKHQRNIYKIDKFKERARYKQDKKSAINRHPLFRWRNFFTKWFLIGLILILISIILTLLQDSFIDKTMKAARAVIDISSGILSTVGIALLVGCIFDFSKNSEAFLEFVSNILTDIILSKTFLTSLTTNDKKGALKLILQPSFKQIEQYSNINEYFKKKIDDSMKMFDTNFKTNLILNIEARKDKKGLVYCNSVLTYVVYKLGDRFEPIKVSYEKDGSRTDEVKLIYDNGEITIKPTDEKPTPEIQGGITQQTFTFEIPDKLKHYDKLTLRRKMYEPGNDHWINYIWQSLTPYEGIVCRLKCFDGLTVKDFMIYDNKAYYQTEISVDRTTLDIVSSQWLEPDTGFFITISDSPIDNLNNNTQTTQKK